MGHSFLAFDWAVLFSLLIGPHIHLASNALVGYIMRVDLPRWSRFTRQGSARLVLSGGVESYVSMRRSSFLTINFELVLARKMHLERTQ